MRLVGERLREALTGTVSGVVVVPYAPEAMWWKLLRYFAVVAHLGCGRSPSHLEANTLGEWRPLAARRESLILAFPRSSGCKVLPLHVDWMERAPEENGYELFPASPTFSDDPEELPAPRRFILSLPTGAFVYSRPAKSGDVGALYCLVEDYRPATEEESFGPVCDFLLVDGRTGAARACPGRVPVLIDSRGSKAQVRGGSSLPHQPDGDELFVVTHLVERVPVPKTKTRGWGSVTDYFYFNAEEAERQISRVMAEHDGVSRSCMLEALATSTTLGPPEETGAFGSEGDDGLADALVASWPGLSLSDAPDAP